MRFPILAIAASLAGTLGLAASQAQAQAQAQAPGQRVSAQEQKNIAVVRDFWREVHQQFHGEAAPKYLAPDYIEHNNGGINGSERMAQFFSHAPPMMRQMKTVSQTVYAGGPFVLLHQHRTLPDAAHPGKSTDMDMIEMIRVNDGLLQEHWMAFAAGQVPPMQPQTEQEQKNIAVVKSFWHDVWEGRDGSAIPRYVAVGYTEQGAGEANGREAMVQRFGRPLPAGAPRQVVQSETVYARGPFVLLHQQRTLSDPAQPGNTRSVDLLEMFRVYDGLLQQHWTFYPVDSGTPASWGE